MLYISVIDSGAGISTENQKKLFKEVIQFHPEKLQSGGGSGFGLYICKGIVDLHEGFLSVFSEGEGLGSTFTVQLPMEKASNQIRLKPVMSPRLEHMASDLSRSNSIGRHKQSSIGSDDMGNVMNNSPNFESHRDEVGLEKGDGEIENTTTTTHSNSNSNKNSGRTALALSQRLPPLQQLPQKIPPSQQATYRLLLVDDSGACLFPLHCHPKHSPVYNITLIYLLSP